MSLVLGVSSRVQEKYLIELILEIDADGQLSLIWCMMILHVFRSKF